MTSVCNERSGTGQRGHRRVGSDAGVLLVVLLGAAGIAAAVAAGTGLELGSGVSGPLFVGLAGLAARGDDDEIDRLVEKIERAAAGEDDVAFETDREDAVGRLYDAVGSLASAAEASRSRDADAEQYRRELYRITSNRDLECEERIRRLLELGCERLDVESGLLARADEASGRYEVETVAGGDFVEEGTVADLSEARCREATDRDGVLAISDADGDDADLGLDVDCFVCGRIDVDDDRYGALCFVDPEPRGTEFTHDEKLFVDLLTRWVSRELERRAHTAELRLRTRALEAAPVGVTITDPTRADNPIVYANERFEELTGYPVEEVIGRNCRFLQGEETAEEPVEAMRAAIDAGESVTTELRNYRRDGTAFWNRVSVSPVRDEDGDVTRFVGFQEDVTERTERERELERQGSLLDSLFEQMPVALFVKDREGRHLRTSAPYLFDEYPDDEEWFRGKTDLEIYPEELAEEGYADDMRVINEEEPVIEKVEYDPEDEEWLLTSKVPWRDSDGETRGLLGFTQQITDQKERERELRETKRHLELVLEGTNTGIWEWDLATDEVHWNETLEQLVGLEPGGFEGTFEAFRRRVHPEDESAVEAAIDQAAENDELYQTEFRLQREDGEWIWIGTRGRLVFDEDGHRRLVGIINDVTDRKETERRLSRLIDNVPGYVYRSEAAAPWAIEFVSEGVRDITGYDPETLESGGVNWDEDVIADWNDELEADIRTALDEREPFYLTYPIDTADGERRWVKEQGRGVYAADGSVTAIEGVVIDVTEQRTYERELERTTDLLQRIQELADVGGWELDVQTDPPASTWTEEMYRLHDMSPGAAIDPDSIVDSYHPDDRDMVRRTIESSIDDGTGYDIEGRILTDDGEVRWVRTIGHAIEVDGEVAKLRGAVQDVTEQKEREAELERTTRLLEKSQRIAEVGGWTTEMTDGEPQRTQWTDQMFDIFDLDSGDLPFADEVADFYHPDVRAERRAAIERAIEDGEGWDDEARLVTANGNERWVRTAGEPVVEPAREANRPGGETRSEDGGIVRLYGAVQDVTEQKEREMELQRTRDMLQQAGRLARVGGWELDLTADPPEMTWTDELYDIHGLSPDTDVDVETVVDLYHPDDRAHIRDRFEAAIERGEGYDMEVRIRSDDGGHRWVRALGEAIYDDGEVVTLRGSIQDVTEQKERERELRATKDRMKQFIETSPVGVVGTEPDGTVTLWNDGMEQIFGWSEEEVLGEPYPAVPEDVPEGSDPVRQRVLDGEPVRQVELVRETSDGDRIDVSLSAGPVRDETGEITEIVGYIEDITERKERERQIQETNERLNAIIDASPDAIVAIDSDGDVEQWNPAAERIFGWSAGDVLGEPMPTVPDDRRDEHEEIRRRLAEGETIKGAEVVRRTKDGDRIDVSLSAAPLRDADGALVGDIGVIEDITERKERERELERTKDMLAQAQRLAAVGGWEMDLSGDEPALDWTDELYRIHGLSPGTDVSIEEALDFYHPEDRSRVREAIGRVIETGGSYDEEARFDTADGEQRWVRTIGKAIQRDGETVKMRGAFQDITRQKERELALQSLHDATRGLLHTESETDVAELVVETAAALFDVPGVAVYTIDDTSNRLTSVAHTDAFESLSDGAPAVGIGDDAAVWNCFATGERVVFDDAETARQSRVFGASVDSGLLVPMGDHGVFVVATDGPRIDDETRRLAETLVATTEAAFDRLASEADLRKRDAELEAQNQRLRRQVQINDIIRRVDQSLVGATSREGVESAVCERLVESEDVAFAWIGEVDAGGDELVPRTWAGSGQTYLDALPLTDLSGSGEPALVTAATGEPTVVGNVVDRLREDSWRRETLANGFHSVISVPLAVDDYAHGVLTVYAGEPDVFGDLERTVFAELGQSIANAINAVSTREALHADTAVELTLDFDDPAGVLARVARDADCEVEYEGISTRSADETRLFFATTGASADAVEAVLDDRYAVTAFRLVSESDDGRCLFEATVTGTVLPSSLVDRGASPRSIRATPTGTTAVVDLPTSTDVRRFVETLRETFPSVELAGRRDVERGMGTRQQMLSSLMEELTDRQLEVLRTAYFAGFFEWPRASTGEEVAEMLDVTQPTVNRHLRLGQQRLLAQLFDEEAPDLVAA